MRTRAKPETEIVTHRVWRTISKGTSVLLLITLFESSLTLASTSVENTKPQLLPSSKTILNQLPPVAEDTLAPPPAKFLSLSSPVIQQGTQVSLNGRMYSVAWRQWRLGASVRTGISDVGLMQSLGMELLTTKDLRRQPVQWFSSPETTPLVLASQLGGSYRYLDVSDFARTAGLQLQVEGNTLKISSLPAQLRNIQQETQPWGSRIVLDLDRATPWQVSDRRTEGVITLDALADPSLMELFKAPPPQLEQIQGEEDAAPVSAETQSDKPVIRLENAQNQTTIRVQIPEGKRLQVFSVANPYRLVIDIRPDALVEKEILWAPGIRWRQKYVNLGESRFPVVWLEVDPKANRMSFRPIWSNRATQVGTAPLMQMAPLWQATAAINAGFFNRNNRLPLGAIRRDGRWFSGPILNRGAIAWNDKGQFKIGRLSLQETLIPSTGERLPVLVLNSGYVQAGIARYTPEWGATYTPLTDNEVLVVVQNNRVTAQIPGGIAGQTSFPIPANGYLLTLRADGTSAASSLGIGTQVRIIASTTPADFASYPQILGAGPLLLQNRQIVLDAKAEQFGDAFSQQAAVRSCVGTTAAGTVILAAIHNRVGGRGPTLAETAQLMQQMGAIDALNFDGGSSTGLYLGGQLLDRSPYTAARVHNALGLFLSPLP